MPTDDRDNVRFLPIPSRRPTTTGAERPMHLRLVPTATSGRASFAPTTTIDARRAFGSAIPTERTAMNAFYQGPSLPHVYAESRRRDMLAEAEQARRLAQAASGAPRRFAIAALRQRVGAALVRAGERVQGAGAGRPADARPTIGTLRAAR